MSSTSYHRIMWQGFFAASSAGTACLLLLVMMNAAEFKAVFYGWLVATLPQAWSMLKGFQVKQETFRPQNVILAVWVRFGLSTVAFAAVFSLPNVQAGSVFVGFLVMMVAFTVGNIWASVTAHKQS